MNNKIVDNMIETQRELFAEYVANKMTEEEFYSQVDRNIAWSYDDLFNITKN